MIRNPDKNANCTMTVVLKNGEKFINMDIQSKPFGDNERTVSFWLGDALRVYPLSDVEYAEFNFDKNLFKNNLIFDTATRYNLSANVVYGVCVSESSMNQYAARYEDGYKWLYKPESVKPAGCSLATEIEFQKTSLGIMQVMGSVYRELGYSGWLAAVFGDVATQLDYGCRHLANKIKKYGFLEGVLSYNSGSPRKDANGNYVNLAYLTRVMRVSKQAAKDGLFPDSDDSAVVWV